MVIGDLIEDQNLVIYCKHIRCSRSVHLTRAEAIKRFGVDYRRSSIRERSLRTNCGSVGEDTNF